MDQLDPTTLSILIAVISLISVIIGSSITAIGNLLTKRQERLAQIAKLIAEKRLAAHEEVITTVRFASIGVGEMEAGKHLKQPLILSDLESYHKWSAEYIVVCRRVTHLIDRELDYKLWVFQNYLLHFGAALDRFAGKDRKYSDPEKAKLFGTIVYGDFMQMTSDILEEASKFFNQRIFHSQFTPASMSAKDYKLPENFSTLALFSKMEEINRLLTR